MGTMEILHSYNLNINLHLNLYIEEIDWYKIVIQFWTLKYQQNVSICVIVTNIPIYWNGETEHRS